MTIKNRHDALRTFAKRQEEDNSIERQLEMEGYAIRKGLELSAGYCLDILFGRTEAQLDEKTSFRLETRLKEGDNTGRHQYQFIQLTEEDAAQVHAALSHYLRWLSNEELTPLPGTVLHGADISAHPTPDDDCPTCEDGSNSLMGVCPTCGAMYS